MRYLMSLDRLNPNAHIYIYGAGSYGEILYKSLGFYRPDIEVAGFVDSFKTGELLGLPVIKSSDYDRLGKYDHIIIATDYMYWEEITETLINYDIKNYYINTFFDFDIYGEKQCNKYQKFEKLTSLVKDIFKDEKDKEIWDVITKSMEEYNVNYILKYFEEKESLEENYLKKVRLSANDIVFDGGAYDGKDVLEFAGKVGDKGLVYAFDPRAKLEQQFKGNSFSNIVIVPKALCDKRAEMFFVDTGSTTVLCNDWHEGAISVESITIDGFVDENKINRLDFVKLDVEGSELDVLRGGERSIKKLKPKMAISIYHKLEHFFEIPLYLNRILPDYSFHLSLHNPYCIGTLLHAIPV